MRIGVTGHQSLKKRLAVRSVSHTEAAAWEWVAISLNEVLKNLACDDIIIVSSLAAGADQMFARLGLEAGAILEIVIPSIGYEDTLDDAKDRLAFYELLEAGHVEATLPYQSPSEEAFFAAGKRVVELSNRLVAVWDEKRHKGLVGPAMLSNTLKALVDR